MPKELADLDHRGAAVQQVRGQAVAQQVRALRRRAKSRAGDGSPDDRAYRDWAREASAGRLGADEHAPQRAAPTITAQVLGQCMADIRRNRETVEAPSLAADAQFARLPVDVVEGHLRHLARA